MTRFIVQSNSMTVVSAPAKVENLTQSPDKLLSDRKLIQDSLFLILAEDGFVN